MIFYHSITDLLEMTELLPANETGNLREEWRKKLVDEVFFHGLFNVGGEICVESSSEIWR